MKQELSASLRLIYELELALGNQVVQVRESSHTALPLAAIFKEPLHRAEVESKIQIAPPVLWYAVGRFAGYVSEDTRQSLQGPTPGIAEVVQCIKQRLSPNLQSIFDLELLLGNTVVRVDEPAGSLCSLATNFKNPLHKTEIEATLPLPSLVKWLENHDPHYSIDGGYKCEDTSHVLVGPLR